MDKTFQYGKEIIRTLKHAGYEAYFVGGYVRDQKLNIPTSDIDITTSATIEEIKPLFKKVILTGEKYGTVTVLYNNHPYEITTYRKDGLYKDLRHPEEVTFTKTLKEDLSRRDFTINQLVMDENEHVFDHFEGLKDLNNKLIRTINNPMERFNEDALRLLRAFRFIAKLDFTLEEKTAEAISACAPLIQKIAIERIQSELDILLKYPYKEKAFKAMLKTNFSTHFFNLEHAIKILSEATIPYPLDIAYTVFYLENQELFNIFRLSKKRIRAIEQLSRIVYQTSDEPYTPELLFHEGLEPALNANIIHQLYKRKDQAYTIQKIHQALPIYEVCELAFKGEDIIKTTNIKKPRYIGYIIDTLILDVIHHRVPNTYDDLKKRAEEVIQYLEKSDLK